MSGPLAAAVPADIGERLHRFSAELFPFNRSITGQGVRNTLAAIAEVLPLELRSLPTGAQVFDWTIPKEWNLKEAYVEDAQGRRIIDSRAHNLHVMSYSTPVDARMTLDELEPHLHSLPEHPDWIPYRTSYYQENWGLCLTHHQRAALTPQRYRVRIDATLERGVMDFGEAVLRGETAEEFLLSAHVCHPSLANDNLSGIAIAAFLGRELARLRTRYTYRIVFAPGTIGAIAWLATHEEALPRIKHGLVAALLGRPGPLTYKKTRSGNAPIDRAAAYVLSRRQAGDRIIDFAPWGYDERQFNSPGIGLSVGRLTRAPEGAYAEYHTSADNLELVTPAALEDAYRAFCEIIDIVERNTRYRNVRPHGEPQLGKYGLYGEIGGASSAEAARLALLWVLNLSDGSHDLLNIAERSGASFDDLALAADRLQAAGLLDKLAVEERAH
jgi:aminopeptidase-like protein